MALSFTEKRGLQKTVADGMAKLKEGKATFSEKRALQKAIQEAMAKLNAKAPAAPTYADWERTVTVTVQSRLDISNGDAQAVVEAQEFIMQQAWTEGLDAIATAERVLNRGAVPEQNQKLADLIAGKFDSLDPLAFLGKLKEIADEINDIEPLKGPAIAYIEKNSDKVSAIMESAMQEAFGKLWNQGATA